MGKKDGLDLVVRGQECCWLPFRTWNSTYCKLQKSVVQWLWWKAEAGLILIYNVSCRISSVFQYHSKQVSISSASIFAWYIMKSQPIIYFLLLFIWFTQYSLLIAFIICTLSCTCAHTCACLHANFLQEWMGFHWESQGVGDAGETPQAQGHAFLES